MKRLALTSPGAALFLILASGLAAQDKKDGPDIIRPGDRLHIHVVGTFRDLPIKGIYRVEPSGKVALGPIYGRVKVAGSTLEDAEKKIIAKLEDLLEDPAACVTRYDPTLTAEGADPTLERQIRLLQEEVQALRLLLEELRKKL